jgi:hypothetical protein
MSKDELIEMLKIANCDINTIIFAVNAWEMGAEWEREKCAIECENISNQVSNWPAAFAGVTAETKFMRSIGETIGKPFVDAIRARGEK